MPLRFLPDFGKTYILDTVLGAGPGREPSNALVEKDGLFGGLIHRLVLSRSWTFLHDSVDPADLKNRLNLKGVADQVAARDDMALDVHERAHGRDDYIVYYDPWSNARDIGYDVFVEGGARIGLYEGHVYKVCDGRVFTPRHIDDLIAGISYLKLVFTSHADLTSGMSDAEAFRALMAGATCLYVNAFDDESWIAAAIEAIELIPPAG